MMINRLPFLFAISTFLLVVASFILRSPGEEFNYDLLVIAFYFAAAYWLLTIIMVASARRLKHQQKKLWLMIVFFLPFAGGILYQLIHPHARRNTHRQKHVVPVSLSEQPF